MTENTGDLFFGQLINKVSEKKKVHKKAWLLTVFVIGIFRIGKQRGNSAARQPQSYVCRVLGLGIASKPLFPLFTDAMRRWALSGGRGSAAATFLRGS